MARILFYTPFNNRSRDTESLMIAFKQQGHDVIFLTQQEGQSISAFLRQKGINAYAHIVKRPKADGLYYLKHLIFFISFCWKHKIEIVYSHLEPASFVASVGQFFIRARVFLCRHHIDEGRLYNFDKNLSYRITYALARQIIVVSAQAKKYMVEKERISATKIKHINLAYDFDLYKKCDPIIVNDIKQKFKADLLLLSVCRMTLFKRPQIAIETLKILVDQNIDAKLILLGKGDLEFELHQVIKKLDLEGKVFMLGYVDNVLEYMTAADFFLHPSILESSCVAIKEAGLVNLPVIVCEGVGDFDEYLINGRNGFVVNSECFAKEASELLIENIRNKGLLREIGANLNTTIHNLFDLKNAIGQYSQLNEISE
jgi:glycosyltransferase involved in cell wall biosynthesis